MDENDIAYCGVECSKCCDLESGKCPGCRKTQWADGDECLPVGCCRKKGIAFCGECPGFPCEEMKEFYTESENHEKAFELMTSLHGKR